ncbi:MAG: cyclic nucleotide-binding domain-containing protein [Ruminococcus sp.]|uniref:Crp/Fnr family transcriptional regulator n=1 Tax=Ruminococcus sp. TaxID=41978 RepID=UPI0025E84E41|nr:cyclic nucleotide-binding domain-containing protein [Ruminococcus sp.]MCR4796541.1 cyclic nucleotide-binding domain-containing protein [Ruminococcus sp.]
MNTELLLKTAMFVNFSREELETALMAMELRVRSYRKGANILSAGTMTNDLCIVADGSVSVESSDTRSERKVLSIIMKGQTFAAAYAMLPDEPLLVDYCANEDCSVLFLDMSRLADRNEEWAVKLRNNLLMVSLRNELMLSERSYHTASKSARGRIMAYLGTVALQTGKSEFDIPYDRQQMADHLNLERTALSKELSRMRAEGMIDYCKNHFVIFSGK